MPACPALSSVPFIGALLRLDGTCGRITVGPTLSFIPFIGALLRLDGTCVLQFWAVLLAS